MDGRGGGGEEASKGQAKETGEDEISAEEEEESKAESGKGRGVKEEKHSERT